ncbi:MAG: macro domain-containing protein [Pseudomonadota bacterium]|nr:macro domain-containing protein [Pseudomonadota bacterium]
MDIRVVEGDLLTQPVEVIVNAWNRNIIPWWLLLPQGVSKAIKRHAGYQPFIEVGRHGVIALGHAVLTNAGRSQFKAIIHVAGISMWWVASSQSIQDSVRSAMTLINQHGFESVAFPMIGAGTGGFSETAVLELVQQTLVEIESTAVVYLVLYRA